MEQWTTPEEALEMRRLPRDAKGVRINGIFYSTRVINDKQQCFLTAPTYTMVAAEEATRQLNAGNISPQNYAEQTGIHAGWELGYFCLCMSSKIYMVVDNPQWEDVWVSDAVILGYRPRRIGFELMGSSDDAIQASMVSFLIGQSVLPFSRPISNKVWSFASWIDLQHACDLRIVSYLGSTRIFYLRSEWLVQKGNTADYQRMTPLEDRDMIVLPARSTMDRLDFWRGLLSPTPGTTTVSFIRSAVF